MRVGFVISGLCNVDDIDRDDANDEPYQPTQAEIAAITQELQAGWCEQERLLRMEWATDAQVGMLTEIMRPMAIAQGLIEETIDERAERLDAERERFIGEAIMPLVHLFFDRRHWVKKRSRA